MMSVRLKTETDRLSIHMMAVYFFLMTISMFASYQAARGESILMLPLLFFPNGTKVSPILF